LELDDTQRNQIIKDLKILAGQNKIIESEPGKYLIKAESKEYYEGKIDMTGRKQPTLSRIRGMFYSNKQLKSCLR
jgi:ribonuclease R